MYNSFKKSWRLLSASLTMTGPALFATPSLPAIPIQERPSVIQVPAEDALRTYSQWGERTARTTNAYEKELQKASAAFRAAQEEHAALAGQLSMTLAAGSDSGSDSDSDYESETGSDTESAGGSDTDTDDDFEAPLANPEKEPIAKVVQRLRESVASTRAQLTQAREDYAQAQDALILLHESAKAAPGSEDTAPVTEEPFIHEDLKMVSGHPDDDFASSFDAVQSTVGLGQESFDSVILGREGSAFDSVSPSLEAAPSRSAHRLRGALRDAKTLYADLEGAQQAFDDAGDRVETVWAKLEALEEDLAAAEAQYAPLRAVEEAFEKAVALGEAQVAAREELREYREYTAAPDPQPKAPFRLLPLTERSRTS